MSEKRILIVDDEYDFAETLAERLQLRDFTAEAVGNAVEALSKIHDGYLPEVVLLDLKLPGLDGLEILDLIKQYDRTIEVIMVTGHGSTASGIAGMQRGLFDYLMKPVDIGELVGKINQAVEKRRKAKAELAGGQQ